MLGATDGGNDTEMHRRVEWLKPSDRPILAELSRYDGWLKPASLALNTPYSQYHVADRMRELARRGLVERYSADTPAYRANDLSRAFLGDQMSVEDLEGLVESDLDDMDYPEREDD